MFDGKVFRHNMLIWLLMMIQQKSCFDETSMTPQYWERISNTCISLTVSIWSVVLRNYEKHGHLRHISCVYVDTFITIAGSPSQVQVLWIGRSSQPIRAQYYTDWPITGQIKGSPPFLNHLFSWMISNISIDAHSAAIKGFGTQLCTSTYHPTQ